MEIRNYQPADRMSVVRLWNAVFTNPAGRNEPQFVIETKQAAKDSLFYVAVVGDRVVGTVMGGYDGHRGWIYSLAVDASHRRRGIGRQMMQRVEQSLAAAGCPKINLQIRAGNEVVTEFYRRLGYRVEERISMGKLMDAAESTRSASN